VRELGGDAFRRLAKAPDSGTSLPRYSSNDAAMIAPRQSGVSRGRKPAG
jgi:hypothetical protein